MKHLSLFLCFKYLGRKKMVLLSIACVAMCCGLLIIVSSLFSGFIDALENTTGDSIGNIIIEAPGGLKIPEYDILIEMLERDAMVEAATGVLSTNGGLLYLGQGNVRGVYLWGIEVEKRSKIMPFNEYLLSSKTGVKYDTQTPPDTGKGYIGIGVVTTPDDITDEYDFDKAREFVGTKVGLITGTSQTEKPKVIRFNVTDLVYSGIYQYDSNFVYLPIEDVAAALFPGQGKIADTIHIIVPEGVDIERARQSVTETWLDFGKDRIAWASRAYIDTAQEKRALLISEYRKQMGMLMLIFGVVSGGVILLIFCIFYLLVMTKFKDIAIIKSCGLGATATAALFVIFGLFVGITGAALGILFGWVVTINVNPIESAISSMLGLKLWKASTYMFNEIPNVVYWEYVLPIAGTAILAAAIGALVPAVAAARIRPVKILRYE